MARISLFAFLLSFLGAFVLSLVYIPPAFQFWRPDWTAMVLFFWVVTAPHRVGVLTAWSVGLIQDILEGAILGMNALAFAVIAYLLISLYQRFKVFPFIQQSFMVFLIIGINLMICHFVKSLTGISASGLIYLYPAISSAALWPFFLIIMEKLNQKLP
ncbi:rod shape-determining protein MreD [Oleiphilus messinensis]|uniref:Rod shape-determining protein MreD n=1 Tax=Oleiphilus messinensis TaxID=141451 RepID=A0A1Y0I8Z6_9GAMM|nr:rod shape-determining protein MreD [Oleiphilus messinensis]ARU55955.1 rod shape-determining protein MreD [Oleiphilus messinensis]